MKNVRHASRLAYSQIQNEGIIFRQREKIYAYISARRKYMTRGEAAKKLKIEKSSMSARVNELLHEGKLFEGEKRKDELTGRLASVLISDKKGTFLNLFEGK